MRGSDRRAEGVAGRDVLSPASRVWFRGYGTTGLSFSSGHLLAFGRATTNPMGPPFTSIWHRSPSGAWAGIVDENPDLSGLRYFGGAGHRVIQGEIDLRWEKPERLILTAPHARLQWALHLSADSATRFLSLMSRAVPSWMARRDWLSAMAGRIGEKVLGLDDLALSGRVPNGQQFVAIPRSILRIQASTAVLEGADLGPLGPLPGETRAGGFSTSARGLFVRGQVGFR